MTRVLVVDDHDIVRRGLCSILSSAANLDVVCETSTGEDAVEKAREHSPDLVLLDITLPGISGLETAIRIRSVSQHSVILFVSQHNSVQIVREALRAGGTGYLLKSEAGKELLDAIRIVQGGGRYVSKIIGFSEGPGTA